MSDKIPSSDFPRGLVQPEDSYKFGQDSLLLASWAARTAACGKRGQKTFRMAEIGCGCGSGLFAFGLLMPLASMLGIEREERLLEAAKRNASLMEMADRTVFIAGDLCRKSSVPRDWRESCLMVMANPPWHVERRGQPSGSPLRQDALCALPDALSFFCDRAGELLCWHGFFCCILPAARLVDFCGILQGSHLGLRKILPVASLAGKSPARLLIMCQKSAQSDPEMLFPLVTHKKTACGAELTKEAREFCPWL